MTHVDDLATVVSLACLTEDRTTSEQRALLRVAVQVERERNKATSRNLRDRYRERSCTIVDDVERTHRPGEYADKPPPPVKLSAADRARVDRWRLRWDTDREEFARTGY